MAPSHRNNARTQLKPRALASARLCLYFWLPFLFPDKWTGKRFSCKLLQQKNYKITVFVAAFSVTSCMYFTFSIIPGSSLLATSKIYLKQWSSPPSIIRVITPVLQKLFFKYKLRTSIALIRKQLRKSFLGNPSNIFALARFVWTRHVTEHFPAKTGVICEWYSPSFKTACFEIMKTIASIWRANMPGYLSLDIICSSQFSPSHTLGKLTIFFRQMEAFIFLESAGRRNPVRCYFGNFGTVSFGVQSDISIFNIPIFQYF